ncbi:MAG: hypothetical protein R2695_03755 [Acidimicrobiales bacterium]
MWPHADRPAELVRELKYGRATTVVTELAEAMAGVVVDSGVDADLVAWIPASPSRRRRRGFDQSELLARSIARRIGVRPARLLRRLDDTPQTARTIEGRRSGPSLVAAGRRLWRKPVVLVVDDVVTTGATFAAARRVLGERGAGEVIGLAATAAPLPARQRPDVYHLGSPEPPGG